ncbi:MAG: translation elongation factor Ts, partial [Candidatus Omnitrophica bacterium]|nr:translation elongation factor Ts [Candidatus Omnitrophota bacterium]
LESSGGDLEKAIDFLRKKGMAQAAKRAGREANEGLVVASVHGKKAALVEANCETDFVARTDDFKELASMALAMALEEGEAAIRSEKVLTRIAELSGKIGEKIVIRRAKVLQSDSGSFFSYIHSNRKLGVVIEVAAGRSAGKPEFQELGKNLAMQVAASNPLCVTRDQMPADLLAREKAIYREEIKGKPEAIVEKILQGKLEKFYQTQCLLEQPFIRDDKVSVKDLLNGAAKTLGDAVEVRQFVRFQLGEAASS